MRSYCDGLEWRARAYVASYHFQRNTVMNLVSFLWKNVTTKNTYIYRRRRVVATRRLLYSMSRRTQVLRRSVSAPASAADAKFCWSCKSWFCKFDTVRLKCRQHYLCKTCLRRKATTNVHRMYVCSFCSSISVSTASIYTFVDHDNLLLEAQKLAARYFESDKDIDHRVRINYRALGDIIAAKRDINLGKVYNCQAVYINDSRFSLKLTEASFHTGGQKEVDTRICVDIMSILTPTTPATVVLVSGDRDILPALEKVLEAGWRVEIYMWEKSTAARLKELARDNEKCEFISLNIKLEDIISRNYIAPSEIEEESSIVLSVSYDQFKEEDRVYKTHPHWWQNLQEISKWPVQYRWLESVQISKRRKSVLEKPRLLLVFKGLGERKTKSLLSNIPSLDEDPHQEPCEMYSSFKQKLEQSRFSSFAWSQVSSRLSTPRHSPHCCSGKNCEEGLRCAFYHTHEDEKYFRRNCGKGFFSRKTQLCRQVPSHCSNHEDCEFAHGSDDGWCTKCHERGHFKRDCKNSECKHPKHAVTVRQLSIALESISS